jgi:hypothetical protein
MESPESQAGQLDKCPKCGYESTVPNPNTPKRRSFKILAGGAGVLAGVFVLGAGTMLTLLRACGDEGKEPLSYSTIQDAAANGNLGDVKRHLARGGS